MIKPLTGETNDFLRRVLPACASGNLGAVALYLKDHRRFVKWIGPHGRTMLWEAARKGRLSIVELLAEKKADLHAIGCYYRETRLEVSPWLVATLNGKKDVADYLAAKGAGLDFLAACYLGEMQFVSKTLAQDKDAAGRPYVRIHSHNGYTVWPLQYAIVGCQPAIVKQLLASGADPQASPRILFDTIDTGQLEVAALLLAAGANPLATMHRGWVESQDFNVLAHKYGYDVKEADVPVNKWPELVDAARGNHNATDDPARVERLIARGHAVNVRDYKGKTALHRASQAGFLKITRLLVNHGADLEARSDIGDTPLFDAAFYGRTPQIELLVSLGADLEARNDNAETPAFAAVRGAKAASLKTLYRLGASLNIVNKRGIGLSDYAKRSNKRGMEDVRQLLSEIRG